MSNVNGLVYFYSALLWNLQCASC